MRGIPIVLAVTSIMCLGSCAQGLSSFHTPESRYGSEAKIVFVHGEVYLTEFLSIDPSQAPQLLGPFIREANGDYFYDDGAGTESSPSRHYLSNGTGNEWWYSWSHIHMQSQPVDGSELVLASSSSSE